VPAGPLEDICEGLPAPSAALAQLRGAFDVSVFASPFWLPEVEPSWRGMADSLRKALTPGCHLVASHDWGAYAMMALSTTDVGLGSFVAVGGRFPPATLRHLGLTVLADSTEARLGFLYNPTGVYQMMARHGIGATDEEIHARVEALSARIDADFSQTATHSWLELNLFHEFKGSDVRCLYLDPQPPIGDPELADIFLKFMPQAEIQRLEKWPQRLADEDAGSELAGRVLSFIGADRAP
jgi:hypothetical protein